MPRTTQFRPFSFSFWSQGDQERREDGYFLSQLLQKTGSVRLQRAGLVALPLLALVLAALPFSSAFADENMDRLEKIGSQLTVADGYDLSVFATVPNARSIALAPDQGGMFVGTRGRNLYFVPVDGQGKAGKARNISSDFTSANGVAYQKGTLFIADQGRVVSFDLANFNGKELGSPSNILFDGLPDKSHHGWRYAALSPDGEKLFVAVGAPCNICKVSGLEGTIITLPVGGGDPEIYASGIRNSVGLTFNLDSGDLWFTDNGGDGLGDNIPREELNHASAPGGFYGYPWFAGNDTRAPDFKNEDVPQKVTFPAFTFNAHNAPLGLHFYQGDLLVALHGSWNRTVPDGYEVVRVKFTAGKPQTAEPFLSGFLRDNGAVLGRPVDIKPFGDDGSVLISDDHAGVIWKMTPRS
ncbi:sorbosone dehydrogenase family protein [Thalassospira sp. TSL5-1]|uniref:PQQ-dependent sugar dehydrogenase n=1 Tax=Thalassospira sp. TSL5-1 TaxID=1544451 RepID=UPI000A8B0601|nr:PQQ-dependent sugar dehydrogenase [Thalassospira sp. TSL5-1]